jgi:hypothetical protein
MSNGEAQQQLQLLSQFIPVTSIATTMTSQLSTNLPREGFRKTQIPIALRAYWGSLGERQNSEQSNAKVQRPFSGFNN